MSLLLLLLVYYYVAFFEAPSLPLSLCLHTSSVCYLLVWCTMGKYKLEKLDNFIYLVVSTYYFYLSSVVGSCFYESPLYAITQFCWVLIMNSLPPIFPLNFSIVLVLEGGKYSKSLNIVDLNLIFQFQFLVVYISSAKYCCVIQRRLQYFPIPLFLKRHILFFNTTFWGTFY